jgi:hypothetical protein
VAAAGAAVAAAAVGGWVLAKTTGVPFVRGLEVAEPVQTADAAAAALAAAAGLLAVLALTRSAGLRLPLWGAAAGVTALSLVALTTVGSHAHPAGDVAHAAAHEVGAAAPLVEHVDAPVPYDPALPIDLGGTDGVTPAQQAEAENLIAVTLSRLPQWADSAVAEAAGFRSIGDDFTGHEHLVNDAFLDDGVILDPDRPESLVYDTSSGERRLVAAMYMLQRGTPLEDVPDFGGALVQWHTHEDLCYNAEGLVRGTTDAAGNCRARPGEAGADADGARVDRAARVRPVRRAGGRRGRPDPRRRGAAVRPRARRRRLSPATPPRRRRRASARPARRRRRAVRRSPDPPARPSSRR